MNAMNTPNLKFNSQLVAPVVAIPPVLGDVTNIALHRQRVVKRKLEEPLAITDDDVANAVIAEHAVSVLSLFAEVGPNSNPNPFAAFSYSYSYFLFKTQVVQNVSGAQVAPPWFAPAIAAALAPLQDGIATLQNDVTAIRADMANLTARSYNALSVADTDPLLPVVVGGVPPANFPVTIAALRSLSGAPLHNLETYYGLPHDQILARRRFRLAKRLGINVPLLRQLAVSEELFK